MDVKLIVANGKNAGQAIPISGSKFFIGRAEDCHLRPHSDLVSRHHCVIFVEDGYAAVRDFGSKNGTYINDQRVEMEQELKNGDRLAVGQLLFEVQLGVEVGGKKKPVVHSVQEAVARTVETAAAQHAAQNGGGAADDLDLGDLLGESEAPPKSTSEVETRTIDATRTEKVETLPTVKAEEKTEPAESPTEEIEPIKKTRADKPGAKTKPKAGTGSANSTDAAASVLKNFFKGRR